MRLTVAPTADELLLDPLRVHPLACPPTPGASKAIVSPYGMVIVGARYWYGYPTNWDGRAATRLGPFLTSGDALTALALAEPATEDV